MEPYMLEKLSRYSFFAFVALLPLQTVLFLREPFINESKWQYGTIGLHGTNILLAIALLSFLMKRFWPVCFTATENFWYTYFRCGAKRKSMAVSLDFRALKRNICVKNFHRWKTNRSEYCPELLYLCMILLASFSLLWAQDVWLALYTFCKLVLAFGLFVLVRSLRAKDIRTIFLLLLSVAFLESLLGVGQFLTQASFASKWLGMSGYESWQAGVSVLKNDSGRWLRAYGTFPHPNIFGSYVGAILLLLLGYFSLRKGRIMERWSRRSSWMLSVSLINVLSLGLLLSFSRSAWLGFGVGVCTLAFVVFLQKDLGVKKWFFKIALVLVVGGAIFTGMLHEVIFPRFDGAIIQREASVIDRAVLTYQALEIIREHPWLGVGAGNYTLAVMQKYPNIPVWDAQPVHNIFLLIWAELGIFGLLLFVGFLFSVFWKGFKDIQTLSLRPVQEQSCTLFRLLGCFLKTKHADKVTNPVLQEASGSRVEPGMTHIKENTIFFIAFLSLVPSLFLDHFLWDSHFGILFFFFVVAKTLKSRGR